MSKIENKPDCPLIGQDGNIYNLVAIAMNTLNDHGYNNEAIEMRKRVFSSDNYYKALNIIGEYVNITSVDDIEEDNENDT